MPAEFSSAIIKARDSPHLFYQFFLHNTIQKNSQDTKRKWMLIILLINIHFPFDISIILFTSFFSILLIDRFNLCSRRSVPPFHKFLPDFGTFSCRSFWYRFYFSHNFLVIMIFLYIWLPISNHDIQWMNKTSLNFLLKKNILFILSDIFYILF